MMPRLLGRPPRFENVARISIYEPISYSEAAVRRRLGLPGACAVMVVTRERLLRWVRQGVIPYGVDKSGVYFDLDRLLAWIDAWQGSQQRRKGGL